MIPCAEGRFADSGPAAGSVAAVTDGGCRRWRAVAPAALCWTDWADHVSLFNADSGETHLLSPLPAELLRLLCRHPWGQDRLSRRLASVCECDDDVLWRGRVAAMLDSLTDLELIEAWTPPVAGGRVQGARLG